MMEENNGGANGGHDGAPQPPQTCNQPVQGQAQPVGAAQQPAGAPYQSGTTFQAAQSNECPVPPYTQQQFNSLDGKATGALVCGILSILLCSTVILGIALGIVAIVLGAQVAGRMVSVDRARVGKVCGIVGLVLSILFGLFFTLVIAAILNVGTQSGAFGDMAGSFESALPSSSSSDQDSAVRQAADDTMAGMRDMDADKQAKLAKKLDAGFEDTAGMGLSETGVDPKELVSWLVSDMSYDIDTVDVQGSTATAYVTVDSRDVDGFTDTVEHDMDAYMGSRTYTDTSSLSDVYTKMGEFMRSSMAQTGNSQKMISLDFSNEDGSWAVDESSMEYAAYEIYGLGSL